MAGEKRLTREEFMKMLAPLPEAVRYKMLDAAMQIEEEHYADQNQRQELYDRYVESEKGRVSALGPSGKPMSFKQWSQWYDKQGPWAPLEQVTPGRANPLPPRGNMDDGMYDVGIGPTGVQRAATGLPQPSPVDAITDEMIAALGKR